MPCEQRCGGQEDRSMDGGVLWAGVCCFEIWGLIYKSVFVGG